MQDFLMRKNFSFFKIVKIKNRIDLKDLRNIISLIKIENKDSILSKLNNKIIENYIYSVLSSKNFFLYLLKKNKEVIGYALLVKNKKYLTEIAKRNFFLIFINLLFNLKFITLLNLLLVVTKLDLLFLKKKKNKLKIPYLNLNLLALNKKYQSQGVGKFFLESILKIIKTNYEFRILTCEAPNQKALNFYLKKIKFNLIGKKIRLFRCLYVLEKNYT